MTSLNLAMRASLLALLWSAATARAQDTKQPLRRKLDERSVLVEWTNQLPSASTGEVTAAAAPQPTDEEKERALAEAFDLSNKGRMEAAIDAFQQILAADPASRKARFGLGNTYIQIHRYQDALAVLEPMIQEFPEDYALKNNIAWLYATAKDPLVRDGRKAVRYAQESILIAPRDYHVWSTLAEAYYVLGEYEKAYRAAEQALRLSESMGVGEAAREEYSVQMEKCQRAREAMSVLE